MPSEPPPASARDAGSGAPPPVEAPELPLKHLHPTSLLFDVLAHGRTYLVPLGFGLLGAANGNVTLLVVSGIAFVPAVAVSVFRYLTLRYRIEAAHLVVTQGLIFRQTRTVPVERIQNVDLVQNVLHRLLGVAEVKIETASGTEAEATLRVLSMAQMEQLREAIFAHRDEPAPAAVSAMAGPGEPAPDVELAGQETGATVKTLLQIPSAWLVKAGLASNRGLIMAGIVVGAYFQFAEDRFDRLITSTGQWLPEGLSTTSMIVLAVVAVVVLLILLRILGIGWYLLRFHGYQLSRRGDDLRISCGLFTRVSATVPRRRIQFISIHRSLLMRWMGLASIRIETAGGAGDAQNATESVSKRWFIPVLPEAEVPRLVGELRPGLDWREADLVFQPQAPRVGVRLSRISFLLSLLIGVAGAVWFWPWGGLAGVAAFPLFWWWAARKARSMRYCRLEEGVVYRSGLLDRKISVTFFDKIQTLRVDQSPFDRRWKMARLSVDTAAAGPANHTIAVPYLDESFAREEFQRLREQTGDTRPRFG